LLPAANRPSYSSPEYRNRYFFDIIDAEHTDGDSAANAMMERYYSPRLRRNLINPLYQEAKRQRIPMTELASRFVEDGLNRLRPDRSSIAEEPVAADPRDRTERPDH
jgi:hypothetical protein